MVVEVDCGIDRVLDMKVIVQGGVIIVSFGECILGCIVVEDIVDLKINEVFIVEGMLFDEVMVVVIEVIGV